MLTLLTKCFNAILVGAANLAVAVCGVAVTGIVAALVAVLSLCCSVALVAIVLAIGLMLSVVVLVIGTVRAAEILVGQYKKTVKQCANRGED